MADRRMYSKGVILHDNLLDLPDKAFKLYVCLMAEADDDGFVGSAKRVVRMVNARKGDLDALIQAGYVKTFDSGVAHVVHWLLHNNIKKDRYKPSIYIEEKNLVMGNCIKSGTKMEPDWNQNGTETEPQYSIDKNRIEKKREDEIKKDNLREEKNSNAITEYDIDNTEEERINSLSSITPPEEEEPIEEVGDITLPEPLGGEAQAGTPTLKEIKTFIAKNGFYLVDAKAFYDYYTKVGWEKAKNWKEKVLRWHFSNNPKWNKI